MNDNRYNADELPGTTVAPGPHRMDDTTIEILLADDNAEHRLLLSRAVTRGRSNVNITAVTNGADFVNLLKEKHFHLALLDFKLTDQTANDILHQVAGAMYPCPIFVVSSAKDQQLKNTELYRGEVRFLSKMQAMRGNVLWEQIESILSRESPPDTN